MKATTAVQKRPLLVIDDDLQFCEWVAGALTGAGFEVLSASNGGSGIASARAARPALIILDIMMPDVDGLATCTQMKQDGVLRDIPVIGVTAFNDLKYTERAFHAGANFFVAKPFGLRNLLHVVALAAT